MIETLETKLELLNQEKIINNEELQEINNLIEKLKDSLLQIIAIKGVGWCSKVTGFHRNNFYNFEYKDNWTVERMIKIYKILLKKLQ